MCARCLAGHSLVTPDVGLPEFQCECSWFVSLLCWQKWNNDLPFPKESMQGANTLIFCLKQPLLHLCRLSTLLKVSGWLYNNQFQRKRVPERIWRCACFLTAWRVTLLTKKFFIGRSQSLAGVFPVSNRYPFTKNFHYVTDPGHVCCVIWALCLSNYSKKPNTIGYYVMLWRWS